MICTLVRIALPGSINICGFVAGALVGGVVCGYVFEVPVKGLH